MEDPPTTASRTQDRARESRDRRSRVHITNVAAINGPDSGAAPLSSVRPSSVHLALAADRNRPSFPFQQYGKAMNSKKEPFFTLKKGFLSHSIQPLTDLK